MCRMYPESFRADYSRLEHTPFTRTRLQQLRAVVVGAGALGNEVTRALGLLGAGRVVLVDPDMVEPSNLPRSIFFCRGNAIGRKKACVLAEAAAEMFPDTAWSAIEAEIADVGFQNLVGASLLFSCVDSDLARVEIAYISTKLQIPVCDAGLGRMNYSHGRVTFFPGAAGKACYACMLTPGKRRERLQWWHATLRPCGSGNSLAEADSVSTPTMAAIVGSLQVEFGLRGLFESEAGIAAACRSLEVDIHPTRWITEFTVPVSSDCPFHEFNESLHPLTSEDSTFEELLNSTSSDALMLDWPICTEAKCVACSWSWSPMQRLAALRRKAECPSCRSRQVIEQKIIRTIGRDSTWLHCPPSALQLPARHLYSVQRGSRVP
jgi:molybdopterin-synthase adenylyltransferase